MTTSHAGGAGEDEGAAGALGVLQARAGAADGLGQGRDGLVLADDAPVELGLHRLKKSKLYINL